MQIKEVMTKNGKAFEVSGDLGLNSRGDRKRTKKRGFKSKRAATDWFNAERVSFQNRTGKYSDLDVQEKHYLVKEVFDIWIAQYEATVEESTLKKTLENFRIHILPQFGERQIRDIKPLDLQLYVDGLQKKLVHYKKVVNYLKKVFNLALRMDFIDVDPFSKVVMPRERVTEKRGKQFLEPDEFKAFIKALDDEYSVENIQAATLLRLVAFTGMRTEEVLALQWKHVDFKKSKIQIVQALGRGIGGGTYLKGTKSKSSSREIFIATDMMKRLEAWNNQSKFCSEDDFVFQNEGHTLQIQRPNKWLYDVAKRYGVAVGISIHKLRHTWPTLALAEGASVKQVQSYLGHADAQLTLNIYSALTKEEGERTGEILSQLIQ